MNTLVRYVAGATATILGIYYCSKNINGIIKKKKDLLSNIKVLSHSNNSADIDTIYSCDTNFVCPILIEIYVKTSNQEEFHEEFIDQQCIYHRYQDEWTKIYTINNLYPLYKFTLPNSENILFNSEITSYLTSFGDLNYFIGNITNLEKKLDECVSVLHCENQDFRVIQKRVNTKKIYVYGSFNTNGIFNCKIMGPNKNEIIDKIYNTECTVLALFGIFNVALLIGILYKINKNFM